MANIPGTPNNDLFLTGTPDPDTITGLEGNDFMAGANGDDVLFGGLGDDAADGGFGNDALVGGGGNDFLNGSEGNDNLYGETGVNYLAGGWSDDNFVLTESATGSVSIITDFGLGSTVPEKVIIQQSRFGAATINQFTFVSDSLFYDPVTTDGIQPVVQIAYIPPNAGTAFTIANNLTLGV